MPNNRITENSYQKYDNKITIKNYTFYILGTYNPNLNELILKPVLMY